jgi:predicted DNA-binding transcriptional regulator YafY
MSSIREDAVTRMLWMLQYMQSKGRMAPSVARQNLAISERSVLRYVNALRASGARILYSKSNGVYEFLGFDAELAPIRKAA